MDDAERSVRRADCAADSDLADACRFFQQLSAPARRSSATGVIVISLLPRSNSAHRVGLQLLDGDRQRGLADEALGGGAPEAALCATATM